MTSPQPAPEPATPQTEPAAVTEARRVVARFMERAPVYALMGGGDDLALMARLLAAYDELRAADRAAPADRLPTVDELAVVLETVNPPTPEYASEASAASGQSVDWSSWAAAILRELDRAVPAEPEWPDLANDIRRVDGNHDLGAGELADRLTALGWTRAAPADRIDVDELADLIHEARCGPEEWNGEEHLPWTADHHEWDRATAKALSLLLADRLRGSR